jgi:hypothetical protein
MWLLIITLLLLAVLILSTLFGFQSISIMAWWHFNITSMRIMHILKGCTILKSWYDNLSDQKTESCCNDSFLLVKMKIGAIINWPCRGSSENKITLTSF